MLFSKIKPMLATKGDTKNLNNSDFIYELKVDGIRVLLHLDRKEIGLYTKQGNRIDAQFPEFENINISANNLIIDGELTILTNGKPDFTKVMQKFSAGSEKVKTLSSFMPASIVAFDILYLNDEKLTNMPLLYRKQVLSDTITDNDLVAKSLYVENGEKLFNEVKNLGLEGVIAKRKNSKYTPGQRKSSWLKIKNYRSATMDVLGYVYGTGRLLVGKNGLPVAQVLGIPPKDRKALLSLLPEIETKRKKDVIYIKNGIRCEVKVTLGPSGNIRECVFDRWVS